MGSFRRAGYGALLLCVILSPLAAAEQPADRLKSVEHSLDAAKTQEAEFANRTAALQGELDRLRQRSIAVAAEMRAHGTVLSALESRIAALNSRQSDALESLDRRRAELADLIAALERMARDPPVALIALPASPIDTVRSALLLQAAVPAVKRRAAALRRDLDALAALREDLAGARAKVGGEQQALAAERQSLAGLLAEKARLAGSTRAEREAAAARAAKLAEQAKDLRDLIAKLAEAHARAARGRPKAPPRIARLRPPRAGPVAMPVIGPIIRRFGEDDKLGQPARGVSIRARPAAPVVAPCDGTVVFAGPFKGLGELLIIKSGAEYHLLLAGLARIDSAVGDQVLAGEPVGSMAASDDAQPVLYMELRRDGQPVNPVSWLAAGQTRIKG